MPEKLLCPSYGIPKSLLNQITATPANVLQDINFIDKNGFIQSGTMESHDKITKYVSLSKNSDESYEGDAFFVRINPGAYLKETDSSGYPEIYIPSSEFNTILNTLSLEISAKTNIREEGDYQTKSHTVAVKSGELWLGVSFVNSSYTGGAKNDWSYPTATTYLSVNQNVRRTGQFTDNDYRWLRILLLKFNADGNFKWSGTMTQGYAATYCLQMKLGDM